MLKQSPFVELFARFKQDPELAESQELLAVLIEGLKKDTSKDWVRYLIEKSKNIHKYSPFRL